MPQFIFILYTSHLHLAIPNLGMKEYNYTFDQDIHSKKKQQRY